MRLNSNRLDESDTVLNVGRSWRIAVREVDGGSRGYLMILPVDQLAKRMEQQEEARLELFSVPLKDS